MTVSLDLVARQLEKEYRRELAKVAMASILRHGEVVDEMYRWGDDGTDKVIKGVADRAVRLADAVIERLGKELDGEG